jgi:hypothetical protein
MPSPDLQCLSYVLTLTRFGGEGEEGEASLLLDRGDGGGS